MQFLSKDKINQIREYASRHRRAFVVGGFFLAIASFTLFSDHGLISLVSLESRKSEVESEIKILKIKEDSLNHIIHRLNNDTLEIERIAREKYGMVKKGEKVFYILKSEQKDN